MPRTARWLLTAVLAAGLLCATPSAPSAHGDAGPDADPPALETLGAQELCEQRLDEQRERVRSEVNAYRSHKGKGRLGMDAELQRVAQARALTVAARLASGRRLAHPPGLAAAMPRGWQRYGENLAYGYFSVAGEAGNGTSAVEAWIASSGHRRNLLGGYSAVGVGIACITHSSGASVPVINLVLAKFAKPSISGSRRVGAELTAKPGRWVSGTVLGYQWYRNGLAIDAATARRYRLTAADRGARITVQVTGTRVWGDSTLQTRRSSSRTAAIAAGRLRTAAPAITGALLIGSTVTAQPGSWTSGTEFGYQWYLNGKAVTGATEQHWVLPEGARGRTLSVRVTGRLEGYRTAHRTRSASKRITTAPPAAATGEHSPAPPGAG